MHHRTDTELLAEYVESNSEAAFAEIVDRYAGLVRTAAIRQVGDSHLADDVTQAVFIILSRKASKLPSHTVLPGWLCRTTHFASRDAVKSEGRRRRRERVAAMNSTETDSEEAWEQLAPILDDAVAQLGVTDRNAIILRYFSQQPFEQVGVTLGIGTEAAQKRVSRALEKLRKIFARRGVVLTAPAIAGGVSAYSVQAAPPAKAAAIIAATVHGAPASPRAVSIVKGTLSRVARAKIKTFAMITGLAVGAGISIAAVGSLVLPASTDGYIITGTVNETVPELRGSIRSSFEIKVKGCKWQIRTETGQGRRCVYQFDGENQLWYVVTGGKRGDPTIGGVVESIPVPQIMGDHAFIAWLAYASGCYLADRTNDDVYTFFDIFNSTNIVRPKSPARWEFLARSPGLPKHFEFRPTKLHSLAKDGTLRYFDVPAELNKPFVSAEFNVLSTTNIDNLNVPLSFEYKNFLTKKTLASNIPSAAVIDGIATNITKANVVFDPWPVPMRVRDLRHPAKKTIYTLRDQILPAIKDLPDSDPNPRLHLGN